MNILALEFSSEQRSVAVLKSSRAGLVADNVPASSSQRADPRRLNAFELIETALRQAQLEREEIGCLAVGLGPGSYTGIRAAISIAQAWQLASDIKLIGISSVEALAAEAKACNVFGDVTFFIDAQRGEFYLAMYKIEPERVKAIEPLHLEPLEKVRARAAAGQILFGPDANPGCPSQLLFPQAGALAKLAVGRTDFVPGERLEPIYLREVSFVKAPPARKPESL